MGKRYGVMLAVFSIMLLGFIQLFSPCANAEFTLKEYKSMKQTDMFREYITGVGRGIYWANLHLQQTGESPFYCQPLKLSLSGENYLNILDRYVEQNKDKVKPGTFIELLLLEGLIDTFPCTK
jgi:hypothetical protein